MRNAKLWLLGLMAMGAAPAFGGMMGMNVSATTLALTSSTQQGGQGPKGSTVLLQGDMVYNWSWYGIGMFYLFDIQGSSQKDHMFGPKLELHYDVFYIEGGWAPLTRRDFTDRSIATQKGNGWFVGVGIRFGLEGDAGGWFFQASYKLRFQNIKTQDGVELTEPISIKDGYPLVGIGMNF